MEQTLDDFLVLNIEEDVPLPKNQTEALPELTPSEELNMRVRTIKLLSDLSGNPLLPSDENISDAEMLAKAMSKDPTLKPDFSLYPDEAIAYLAGMVARCNKSLVQDLADYKNYIITKLVEVIENPDSQKNKLVALSKLGEIDGIGAFNKRQDITVTHKSLGQVEQELLETLSALEYRTINTQEALISPIETTTQGVEGGR